MNGEGGFVAYAPTLVRTVRSLEVTDCASWNRARTLVMQSSYYDIPWAPPDLFTASQILHFLIDLHLSACGVPFIARGRSNDIEGKSIVPMKVKQADTFMHCVRCSTRTAENPDLTAEAGRLGNQKGMNPLPTRLYSTRRRSSILTR